MAVTSCFIKVTNCSGSTCIQKAMLNTSNTVKRVGFLILAANWG